MRSTCRPLCFLPYHSGGVWGHPSCGLSRRGTSGSARTGRWTRPPHPSSLPPPPPWPQTHGAQRCAFQCVRGALPSRCYASSPAQRGNIVLTAWTPSKKHLAILKDETFPPTHLSPLLSPSCSFPVLFVGVEGEGRRLLSSFQSRIWCLRNALRCMNVYFHRSADFQLCNYTLIRLPVSLLYESQGLSEGYKGFSPPVCAVNSFLSH